MWYLRLIKTFNEKVCGIPDGLKMLMKKYVVFKMD